MPWKNINKKFCWKIWAGSECRIQKTQLQKTIVLKFYLTILLARLTMCLVPNIGESGSHLDILLMRRDGLFPTCRHDRQNIILSELFEHEARNEARLKKEASYRRIIKISPKSEIFLIFIYFLQFFRHVRTRWSLIKESSIELTSE